MLTALRIKEQYFLLLYPVSGAKNKILFSYGVALTATRVELRAFGYGVKGQALSRLGISLADKGARVLRWTKSVTHWRILDHEAVFIL